MARLAWVPGRGARVTWARCQRSRGDEAGLASSHTASESSSTASEPRPEPNMFTWNYGEWPK